MKITEIQKSINGEINKWHQGSPATFIRLAGCNLWKTPCLYCDTVHALKPEAGRDMSFSFLSDMFRTVSRDDVLVITGGEPLYNYSIHTFLGFLETLGFEKIVIETNGTLNPKEVIQTYPKVNIVIDYKLASSGNYDLMKEDNFLALRQSDYIKFPVKDQTDMDQAIKVQRKLRTEGTMVVSPVFINGEYDWNPDLIRQTRDHGFILSVQIHKMLKCY